MEQLLLFALFYERTLENAANRGRRIAPPASAEPLAPILWHRIDELKPGRLREAWTSQEHSLDDPRCYNWTTRKPPVCSSRL